MDYRKILEGVVSGEARAVGRAISLVESNHPEGVEILAALDSRRVDNCLVVGITGPPGAGKSTLTGALVAELRRRQKRVGVIGVDPSSPLTGGAVLGDRIRMMDHSLDPMVFVRSMATRGQLGGLCASAGAVIRLMAGAGCEVVLVETVGVGQSEMDVATLADCTLLVLAPGFGDDIQAMKAGVLEVADFFVINKADLAGGEALAMQMEQVFRTDHGMAEVSRVMRTTANAGEGVAQLLDGVELYGERIAANGEKLKRRKASMEMESLELAVEQLRPHLLGAIRSSSEGEPRRLAAGLVQEVLRAME
ncbi:MAG: methylmalonyl Co-A mutase-associated GTPase MeaB [Thermodesulfobacteriota bacterium]